MAAMARSWNGGSARVRLGLAVSVAALAIGLGSLAMPASGGVGDNEACCQAISADGRFVAFTTGADFGGPVQPLVDNVYVYDRKRKRAQLVSRQSKARGGAGADADSFPAAISASGRFVAFQTGAQNLGGPAAQPGSNIYVYDRKRKRVQLVSRRSKAAGGGGADDESFAPSISGNGRFVAFHTLADNLGGPINPAANRNVYVYDRKAKRVQLVSRRSKKAGGAGADEGAFAPSISASGRHVAFRTDAANLGGPIDPGAINVYVYDRKRKRVQLVSRQSKAAGGAGANGNAFGSAISGNGRFVAFEDDESTNLGGPFVPGVEENIYVYDRKAKRVQLVSRRSKAKGGGGANGSSDAPAISATGRFVGFSTEASNLGGPIVPGVRNTYVYDRKAKRVRLVSRRSKARGGAGANGDSLFTTALSGSGRHVAFETEATNLGGPQSLLESIYLYDRKAKRVQLVSRK